LGKQLRELREKARLTTEDVGLQLDCSPSTISRMEGGKVGIRRSTLERLLEIYEVTDQEQIDTLVVLAGRAKRAAGSPATEICPRATQGISAWSRAR